MIWLIGSGGMAVDYSKVLENMQKKYQVIGRSEVSAEKFKLATNKEVITGGLDSFLNGKPLPAKAAIVSVGVEQLYNTTIKLLNYGIKSILIEKPGATTEEQLMSLHKLSLEQHANVYIAYNRRFYASVLAAIELIKKDGGVTSFNFEFTEWSHVIESLSKPKEVFEKWFLANSTHIVDLAFYLGGFPKELASFTAGGTSWHPSSSVFSGAGISSTGALFSYAANWESAGRWSVEILTKENRYIFRPMEKLFVQKKGTIPLIEAEVDYQLDNDYKPGLYKQVEAFLGKNSKALCKLRHQLESISLYNKIAKY